MNIADNQNMGRNHTSPGNSISSDSMGIDYLEVLRLASDALSSHFQLNHSALYWEGQEGRLDRVTGLSLGTDNRATVADTYALSDSMISVIRKPLIIVKTDQGRVSDPLKSDAFSPYLLIVLPLFDQERKKGILAFWGEPKEEVNTEADRRVLDMLSVVCFRIIDNLQNGSFFLSTVDLRQSASEDGEGQVEIDDLQDESSEDVVSSDVIDIEISDLDGDILEDDVELEEESKLEVDQQADFTVEHIEQEADSLEEDNASLEGGDKEVDVEDFGLEIEIIEEESEFEASTEALLSQPTGARDEDTDIDSEISGTADFAIDLPNAEEESVSAQTQPDEETAQEERADGEEVETQSSGVDFESYDDLIEEVIDLTLDPEEMDQDQPEEEACESGGPEVEDSEKEGIENSGSSESEGERLSTDERLALEKQLEEKQESIGIILKYSKQGFLLFDRECRIHTEHLRTEDSLFKESIRDMDVLEVLFEWGDPDNAASASFEKIPDYSMIRDLMESVFKRVTDLDVFKELLPTEIRHSDQIYNIGYHYLRLSSDLKEDRILVVFDNVTHEKRLAEQYQTELERTNMIVKVALDVDGFFHFKNSAIGSFDSISRELAKPFAEIDFKKIQYNIQSIQGGTEIYEINELALLTEKIESDLVNIFIDGGDERETECQELIKDVDRLRDTFTFLQTNYLNNLVSDEQILDKTIYRVTKNKISHVTDEITDTILHKYIKELERVFDKNYRPFTRIQSLEEITSRRLATIKSFLWEKIADQCSTEIRELLGSFRMQPVGLVLKRYAIIAVNLGERQKKRVEVELNGAEIEVPLHSMVRLFNSLTYVIRNSVEHGLETMEERMSLNKPLEGKIKIEASLEGELFKLSIADDGKGIDLDLVKQSAIKNQMISEFAANSLTDQDLLRLLFKKGMTAKKDVDGTFGGGVGLSAVGSVVEGLNGDISIQSEIGKGTVIEVSLPIPDMD